MAESGYTSHLSLPVKEVRITEIVKV